MKFNFENLDVWNIAVGFAEKVYLVSGQFPKEESYGITSQLRRAAVSISLNIAEGKGRFSQKEFKHFLYISRGSLYEVITLLKISSMLGYLKKEDYDTLIIDCEVILSKLSGLLNYLKSN